MVSDLLPVTAKGAVVRKGGKTILGPIDLAISGKGTTIVMGPNGSGKTTLLRLLHGLDRARDGSVSWNGAREDAHAAQAFIFQTPKMMRRSVLDNIAYPLRVRGASRKQARIKAEDWATRIGLGDALNRDAQALSGGERQKLALARALVTEPAILFLDEPTTNLDGGSTREIEDILSQALDTGTRLIMATHDIGQARRLADEVIFIHRGTMSAHQRATAFFEAPASQSAAAYLRGDIVE